MKKLGIALIIIILIPTLYVVSNLLFATITDYQPEDKEVLKLLKGGQPEVDKDVLTLMTWNIGYGGLGDQEDFFYDGGTTAVPPEERVKFNLKLIYDLVKRKSTEVDFFLFQEVDTFSSRSHSTNELQGLSHRLEDYNYCYATNYLVNYVPMPLERPWDVMGRVEAGLASFSKYSPTQSIRYQFPGNYSWPKRVYMLDRCYLLQRFELPNTDKQLIVINTHNSAYDGGTLKQLQMEMLKEQLLEEYNQGNYVIVGGDWNQCPPGFEPNTFNEGKGAESPATNIAEDYLPAEWTWAFDPDEPTNRNLSTAYEEGKSLTNLIDFYLLSPNIKLVRVETSHLSFAPSDHQPVTMTIKLR